MSSVEDSLQDYFAPHIGHPRRGKLNPLLMENYVAVITCITCMRPLQGTARRRSDLLKEVAVAIKFREHGGRARVEDEPDVPLHELQFHPFQEKAHNALLHLERAGFIEVRRNAAEEEIVSVAAAHKEPINRIFRS